MDFRMKMTAFGLFLLTANAYALTPGCSQNELQGKLARSRPLKDILAQHGGQIPAGKAIITVDGILEEETPIAEKVVRLQKRIAELRLARDAQVFSLVSKATLEDPAKNIQALTSYMHQAYADKKCPLIALIEDLVFDKNECAAITTEVLRLMSNKTQTATLNTIMRNASEANARLALIEEAITQIYTEILLPHLTESEGDIILEQVDGAA